MLCAEQWDDAGFWWQYMVGEAVLQSGTWKIEIDREGDYRIGLRRWPREVDAPINSALTSNQYCHRMNAERNQTLDVVSASLKLDGYEQSLRVDPRMREATFRAHLKPGPLDIEAAFQAEGGPHRGAYYAYLERL
jgi:hypothetical protein